MYNISLVGNKKKITKKDYKKKVHHRTDFEADL